MKEERKRTTTKETHKKNIYIFIYLYIQYIIYINGKEKRKRKTRNKWNKKQERKSK